MYWMLTLETCTKPSHRFFKPSNCTKHPNCIMVDTLPLYIYSNTILLIRGLLLTFIAPYSLFSEFLKNHNKNHNIAEPLNKMQLISNNFKSIV